VDVVDDRNILTAPSSDPGMSDGHQEVTKAFDLMPCVAWLA